LVDVPLGDRISLGGHPWYVLVVVFAVSLFILAMNFSFMGERLKEIKKPG
jgi:ABC-type dipeptide/oligopeptide/nickel transport system permease subunit